MKRDQDVTMSCYVENKQLDTFVRGPLHKLLHFHVKLILISHRANSTWEIMRYLYPLPENRLCRTFHGPQQPDQGWKDLKQQNTKTTLLF